MNLEQLLFFGNGFSAVCIWNSYCSLVMGVQLYESGTVTVLWSWVFGCMNLEQLLFFGNGCSAVWMLSVTVYCYWEMKARLYASWTVYCSSSAPSLDRF